LPTLTLKDGGGASVPFTSYLDASGNPTLGHTPLVGGNPVASGNPVPVSVRGGVTNTLAVVTLAAGVATQVVAANANRRALAIANIGAGLASMGFANTVTAGAGWPLASAGTPGDQGGGYEWPAAAVHTGAVWAISAAGTTLAVMEG
jgi:hypothetical protein